MSTRKPRSPRRANCNKPKRRKATLAERNAAEFALLSAIRARRYASTDDAHQLYELPQCVTQSLWGWIVTNCQARGCIRHVGSLNSERKPSHRRPIKLLSVADQDAFTSRLRQLRTFASRQRPKQGSLFDESEG